MVLYIEKGTSQHTLLNFPFIEYLILTVIICWQVLAKQSVEKLI